MIDLDAMDADPWQTWPVDKQDLRGLVDEIKRLRNEKNNMIEATKKFVESAQKANDTIDNLWVETQDKHLARIAELEAALQGCEPFVAHFKGGWCTLTHAQISTDELLETIRAALAKDSQTS